MENREAETGVIPDEEMGVPGTKRLLFLAAGVLLFHVMNSVLQEAVFHLPGFSHTVALTFLQTSGIAFFAFLELQFRLRVEHANRERQRIMGTNRSELTSVVPVETESMDVGVIVTSPMVSTEHVSEPPAPTPYRLGPFFFEKKVPWRTYLLLSVLSTVSAILTNVASYLLNYPTQVVFKSSKLLFVMSLRVMLRMTSKKSSSQIVREFVSCAFIVCGLFIFTFATSMKKKSRTSTSTSGDAGGSDAFFEMIKGVLAIIVALCCDAMLYIGEEKYCFGEHKASSGEVILFTYGFTSLNSLFMLAGSGGIGHAIAFAKAVPIFPLLVVAFSACNFCGTHFLLGIVSEFDSNAAVIVTSMRKVLTVLLSYLLYPKPFGIMHLSGLIAVSLGVFIFEHTRLAFKRGRE